jgi:tetratricopeptide (TPR) repeat protein
LIDARALLARGDFDGAARSFDALVAADPSNPVAHCLRAEAELGRQSFAAAESHLRRCLALAPGYLAALHGLAYALFMAGRLTEASEVATRLLALDPSGMPGRLLKAAVAATVGDHDEALLLYRGILGERAEHVPSWLALGHCLRILGEGEQAAAAYREALARNSDCGEAWGCLANLKTHPFDDGDIAAMSRLTARDVPLGERLFAHFALGQALYDRADDAGAYAHYAQGKAIARGLLPQDPVGAEGWAAWVDRAIAELARCEPVERDGANVPVFIVGMPRSGTTLVEQIIGSHTRVEATSELPYLDLIARRLIESRTALRSLDLRRLGTEYLAAARIHRKSAKPWFIDKLPVNWRHVGLIRAILPQARIVEVRRHPLASCVAIFRQHFLGMAELAGSPADIARAWRDYARAMTRFDRAWPGSVYRVEFARLVTDTEAEVRRMLGALDLPFEEGCLRWFENGQPVRTPSSEQVRQPMFRSGLDAWRRFDSELEEARTILADEIAAYGR